jgi:hypothetical protein
MQQAASRHHQQLQLQQQGLADDQQRQSWEWQQWQQQLHGSQAAAAAAVAADGSSNAGALEGSSTGARFRRLSVAQSLLQRKRRPVGSCLWAVSQGKLLAAAFRAWRSVAWVQASTQALQQVGMWCWLLLCVGCCLLFRCLQLPCRAMPSLNFSAQACRRHVACNTCKLCPASTDGTPQCLNATDYVVSLWHPWRRHIAMWMRSVLGCQHGCVIWEIGGD